MPPQPAMDWWGLVVRDDVGTEYEVQGGVSGYRGPNRTIFDSDVDFEPAVPQHATWLAVLFIDRRHPGEPIYRLRADLPLPEAAG
ncbi:MAG: hypothetical protein JOZ41_17615 [Chloroflexi bacterium]|nr:hypothetical protein [Chloroflexota bacterium]